MRTVLLLSITRWTPCSGRYWSIRKMSASTSIRVSTRLVCSAPPRMLSFIRMPVVPLPSPSSWPRTCSVWEHVTLLASWVRYLVLRFWLSRQRNGSLPQNLKPFSLRKKSLPCMPTRWISDRMPLVSRQHVRPISIPPPISWRPSRQPSWWVCWKPPLSIILYPTRRTVRNAVMSYWTI